MGKRRCRSPDLLSLESCRLSAVDHVEDASPESQRKMQDEQEVMSETSGNLTRRRGEDGWRLEPERETGTLETNVFWHGMEGVPEYLDGEGHHERGQVKSSRRERKRSARGRR